MVHPQDLPMVITLFHLEEQPVARLSLTPVTLAILYMARTGSLVSMVTGMMRRPDVGEWVRTGFLFRYPLKKSNLGHNQINKTSVNKQKYYTMVAVGYQILPGRSFFF